MITRIVKGSDTLRSPHFAYQKLLHPSGKAVVLIDMIAIPLVIIALVFLSPMNPVSIIAYILSSYALIITFMNAGRIYRNIRTAVREDKIPALVWFKKLMRKNKYTALYLESADFRAEVSLYSGLAANLIFAVFKGASGVYYHSTWLGSVGVYYLVFGAIRFMLMKNYRVHKNDERTKAVRLHEYKTVRNCGFMMILLTLTETGMAYHMIEKNDTSNYSRLVAIVSAMYTFYYVIKAVISAVSFRKRDNAILAATKKLNISGAAMSAFTLQTAMIHTFDGTVSSFSHTMNSLTGAAVMLIMLWNALSMSVRAQRNIRQEELQ